MSQSQISSYSNNTSTSVPCRTSQFSKTADEKARDFREMAGEDGVLTVEDLQGNDSLRRSMAGQAVNFNNGKAITSWQQLESKIQAGRNNGTISPPTRSRVDQAAAFRALAETTTQDEGESEDEPVLTLADLPEDERDSSLLARFIKFAGGRISSAEQYFEQRKLFAEAGRKEDQANLEKKNAPFCVAPPPSPPAPTYEFPPRED